MRIITYALVMLCLTSCFKEVDIELPDPDPTLVIGGMIENGKPIEIMVSRTLPMDDTLFFVKEDAVVNIEYDGESFQLTRKDEFYYPSSVIAQANKTYSVQVSVDGFPDVTAYDSVPVPANFVIDKYSETAYVDSEGFNYSSLTVNIIDIPDNITYYELRLYCRTEAFEKTQYYYADLLCDDIIVRDEGIVNETYGKVGLLFTNKLIDTTQRKITFFFENEPDDDLNRVRDVYVQLRSVSKSYFLYKKKLYLNILNQSGDVWDGSGNPVDAYSNITNGYGIFAGFSQTTKQKEL